MSGELLLALVNDVLDLSRIEAGALTLNAGAVDVRRLVPDALRIFALTAAGKKLTLESAVDGTVPAVVRGDATRINQVLINLVSNAVKFTEKGGVIVKVSARPAGPGRQELDVSVRDTGIGISADQMKRLFQSFSQADPTIEQRFGGSGLGLVISRRLCELMGGSLEGRSEPGRGSVFTARIVVADAPASSEPGPLTIQSPSAGGSSA